MNVARCPSCGARMKRNGTTSAGNTRWRCASRGASIANHAGNSAKRLEESLGWLLSKRRQADMAGGGRAFRRRTQEFLHIWPLPPATGEVCRVVFVDGICLSHKVCVLIARSGEHVLGRYVARSESSSACKALMARMAPPEAVAADGGSGFQKARRQLWPTTRVQRCAFHASGQVKRCTTTRPRTQAGVGLYALAKKPLKVGDSEHAAAWVAAFAKWCSGYDEFLKEETANDGGGRSFLVHGRLVKARNSLAALARQQTALHLRGPRPGWAPGGPSRHQQCGGEPQRPAQTSSRRAQGALAREACQGHPLAVLHAHGAPSAGSGDPQGDAHGQEHRRGDGEAELRRQGKDRSETVGGWPCLGGASSLNPDLDPAFRTPRLIVR